MAHSYLLIVDLVRYIVLGDDLHVKMSGCFSENLNLTPKGDLSGCGITMKFVLGRKNKYLMLLNYFILL